MTNKATIASLQAQMKAVTNSLSTQMSALRYGFMNALGISHDGKRDLYDVYGYPRSLGGVAGFRLMAQYSNREGIANRITWGMAKSCWRDGFDLYDGPDDEADKVLEDQLNVLRKTGLNSALERVDILNRIGRMAVLYIGVPDGGKPEDPLGKVVNGEKNLNLLYFTPYAYDGINIEQQVMDPMSPRYGLPEFYQLQRIGSDNNEKDTQTKSIRAHWTRVIHLNENALESDIEGMGALEPVFNRILDLDKACGGSAEAYFRNAKGKIAFEIDKDFASQALSDPSAKQSMQDAAERFTNEMQDHIAASGSKVMAINTPHASPLDTVKVLLWEISGYTGIPIRVLTGEGSGQLAGSEDQLALNQIIRDRQRLKCSGWAEGVLRILEQAGMLTLPGDFEVRFPPQEAATESQKAETGNKVADTLLKIAQAKTAIGGDALDIESVLAAVGLEGIEVNEGELDADVDPEMPEQTDGDI